MSFLCEVKELFLLREESVVGFFEGFLLNKLREKKYFGNIITVVLIKTHSGIALQLGNRFDTCE